MSDWIDDFLDDLEDVNEEINCHQIGMIEQLLGICPLDNNEEEEILRNLPDMRMIEAIHLINELKEISIPLDPKDQYEKMRKNGMFN